MSASVEPCTSWNTSMIADPQLQEEMVALATMHAARPTGTQAIRERRIHGTAPSRTAVTHLHGRGITYAGTGNSCTAIEAAQTTRLGMPEDRRTAKRQSSPAAATMANPPRNAAGQASWKALPAPRRAQRLPAPSKPRARTPTSARFQLPSRERTRVRKLGTAGALIRSTVARR